MDVESGKDDLISEDGNLVVFTDVEYSIRGIGRRIWKKTIQGPAGDGQAILKGAFGAIRPGRMTFILGPSGAGKTTLLNILAGRKKIGVSGTLHGTVRNVVLVAQHASLIDSLTAGETLTFAASLKLPNATKRESHHAIETVAKQLGIYEVLNTRAGKLSGGEKKRLTIACELLTDPTIMFLDEPTSGLDSVSSMSVIRALQTVAHSGRTVACVIHQPSSKLFATADDILLVADGRTLYAGAVADIPAVLARTGFVCPQYYNMADYLLEIASGEHTGNIALLESEARSYASEMKRNVKNDIIDKNGKDTSMEAQALLDSSISNYSNYYTANLWQQLDALLWRCYKGALRDVHLTQIRLVCHLIVALLLGALYNGAGSDAGRIISNGGCLFFFLLFLFFSNAMPTIHTFPMEATVVIQQSLNKWYSLTTYCISKVLVDLPVQLLCATVFVLPAWYMTAQPMELYRIALAWAICALVTVLAQTFGLVIGTACGVKLGIFVVPAANIPMLMFSGFFIPYQEMPLYLRPFASISYFRYAFDSFLQTAYGFNRGKLPCHKIYCMFKNPQDYLEYLGLSLDVVNDIAVLVIWIVILQAALVCVLHYKVYKACR